MNSADACVAQHLNTGMLVPAKPIILLLSGTCKTGLPKLRTSAFGLGHRWLYHDDFE